MMSPLAHDDIDKIHKYIAENDLVNANNVVNRIYDVIKKIEIFPKIGSSVKERFEAESNYLYFAVSPFSYLILYIIEDETIFIDRIIDGRRDCMRVLTAKIGELE